MSEPNIEMEILDQLTCPICFVYPEKEVFQCHNGHPICSSCIQSLRHCPQCQYPFGHQQIRCRVMESFLDSVKLYCTNKDAGCTQRFPRKELTDHKKICEFRAVSLCKWMGYECDFAASTVAPLIEHLESCHGTRKLKRISWNINWNVPIATANSHRSLFLQQSTAKTWFLVHVTLTAKPNGQKLLSWVPICLQDGLSNVEHEVHLDLSIRNEQRTKERYLFKWTGIPANYKDAEEFILYSPLQLTSNYIVKEALKLEICDLPTFNLCLDFSVEVKPLPSIQQEQDDAQEDVVSPELE